MFPSREQISIAAYDRWQRRGRAHGRDSQDWLLAEQELIFALNYELIVSYRLDGISSRFLGNAARPRCRFCEGSAPRASFEEPHRAIPQILGNQALYSHEICDDCQSEFEENVGSHLDLFINAICRNASLDNSIEPIAAFKGLTRAALAIIPDRELQYFEDTIEWVGNPDHELDGRTIGGLDCYLHASSEAAPYSWVAVARRIEPDEPYPYMLAFFGSGEFVFQIALPLCVRDEDLEVSWLVPQAASPFGVGHGPIESRLLVIPLANAAKRLAFV
jgi:hypothetical protein